MQPVIAVVAQLPTRIKWLETNYSSCELTWSKDTEDFMDCFQEMETSGRLRVVLSEARLPILTKALLIGPTQLSIYSEEELKFLISNAVTTFEALLNVASVV